MKKRINLTTKNFICYFLIIILLIISIILIIINKSASINTFNIVVQNYLIQKDLTGNGHKDILYVNSENNKYYVHVKTEEKNIQLIPSKTINSFGTQCNYWPMRITLTDISGDDVPEIVFQSSVNSTSVQHIFRWSDNDFKDILCNEKNILGVFDTKTNEMPKIIQGDFFNEKMDLKCYVLLEDKLESFKYNFPENFMGYNTVENFINYLLSTEKKDISILNNIFHTKILNSDKNLIESLKNSSSYTFQDAVFKEIPIDDPNLSTSIEWLLNFKKVSISEVKNLTLKLVLKPTNMLTPNEQKINSISINS